MAVADPASPLYRAERVEVAVRDGWLTPGKNGADGGQGAQVQTLWCRLCFSQVAGRRSQAVLSRLRAAFRASGAMVVAVWSHVQSVAGRL